MVTCMLTVTQAEICRSNPKMEMVILLARELNISLDALVFPETATPNAVPKCVYDFFRGKTENEAGAMPRYQIPFR